MTSRIQTCMVFGMWCSLRIGEKASNFAVPGGTGKVTHQKSRADVGLLIKTTRPQQHGLDPEKEPRHFVWIRKPLSSALIYSKGQYMMELNPA